MANKTKPLKFNYGTDVGLGGMQPYNGFVEHRRRCLAATRSELRPRARKQAISKPDWTGCSYPLDGFVVAVCAHHLTPSFLSLGH
jgi:hypothetical protein